MIKAVILFCFHIEHMPVGLFIVFGNVLNLFCTHTEYFLFLISYFQILFVVLLLYINDWNVCFHNLFLIKA